MPNTRQPATSPQPRLAALLSIGRASLPQARPPEPISQSGRPVVASDVPTRPRRSNFGAVLETRRTGPPLSCARRGCQSPRWRGPPTSPSSKRRRGPRGRERIFNLAGRRALGRAALLRRSQAFLGPLGKQVIVTGRTPQSLPSHGVFEVLSNCAEFVRSITPILRIV
jgi:hypothetical protein